MTMAMEQLPASSSSSCSSSAAAAAVVVAVVLVFRCRPLFSIVVPLVIPVSSVKHSSLCFFLLSCTGRPELRRKAGNQRRKMSTSTIFLGRSLGRAAGRPTRSLIRSIRIIQGR